MSKRIILLFFTCLAATTSQSQAPAVNTDNTIILPFCLHHHLVFIEAIVNGHKGTFVLDSGSPTLVVNKVHVPADTAHPAGSINAAGVNGQISGINTIQVQRFSLGKLTLNNVQVMCMDLTHLEKETGQIITGLIGYDVYKDYEITYDYKNKQIILRKTDSEGRYLELPADMRRPICTVPIDVRYHIPIVDVKMGAYKYKMGIDCGATENLLYRKYVPELKPLISKLANDKLTGADTLVQNVVSASVSRGSIGTLTFINANTTFSDESLDQLNDAYALGIDGLIGYEYLRQHVMSVNFKSKTVKLY